VGIFNTKLETISRVWVPKQQGIFSLYHPLKQLSSILSCHHHAAKEKLIFHYNLTIRAINLSDCRVLPSFLGANLLRLFSLIIQDQECIIPTSTLPIIYQAFAQQAKLNKKLQTKRQYQTKYSATISADSTRSLHEQRAEIQIRIETFLKGIATPSKQIDQQSPVKLVSKTQVTGERKESIKGNITQRKWLSIPLAQNPVFSSNIEQSMNLPVGLEEKKDTIKEEATTEIPADGQTGEEIIIDQESLTHNHLIPTNQPPSLNISHLVTLLKASNQKAIIILLQ
jgi:hypothetical protein